MNIKLLIIVATHGNEKIGLEVVEKLKQMGLGGQFDVLIGNPKACERNIRFLDKDLNRSYSGNPKSEFYEERLAVSNLKLARQYDLIIDMHEASAGRDDFIIVPRAKLSNKFPLELVNLRRILLWPDPKGPVSQVLPNSIELEFGMKGRSRAKVVAKATRIVALFIRRLNNGSKLQFSKKEIYQVFGTVSFEVDLSKNTKLRDFKTVKIKGEDFYPLLVDQYLRLGIKCYKMRKVN